MHLNTYCTLFGFVWCKTQLFVHQVQIYRHDRHLKCRAGAVQLILTVFQTFINIILSNTIFKCQSCQHFWTGFFYLCILCFIINYIILFKCKGKFSKCFFYRRLSTTAKAFNKSKKNQTFYIFLKNMSYSL